MGEASLDDLALKSIVSAVGCSAVSVGYRLARLRPPILGRSRIAMQRYAAYLPRPGYWGSIPPTLLWVARAREVDSPQD